MAIALIVIVCLCCHGEERFSLRLCCRAAGGSFHLCYYKTISPSFLWMSSLYVILNRSKVNPLGKVLEDTDNLANVTVITVIMLSDTLVKGGSGLSICSPREGWQVLEHLPTRRAAYRSKECCAESPRLLAETLCHLPCSAHRRRSINRMSDSPFK